MDVVRSRYNNSLLKELKNNIFQIFLIKVFQLLS